MEPPVRIRPPKPKPNPVHEQLEMALIACNNMSVTQAARLLRVGRPALSRVLNGKSDLSFDMAYRFELEFGLDARQLMHHQLDQQLDAFQNRHRRRGSGKRPTAKSANKGAL